MAAIGVCALNDEQWLKKRLKPPNGVPSHNTIERLLTLIKPNLFQKCPQAWIQSLASPKEDKQANQIAIDKKVLKRSPDRKNGLDSLLLVSAWAVGTANAYFAQ